MSGRTRVLALFFISQGLWVLSSAHAETFNDVYEQSLKANQDYYTQVVKPGGVMTDEELQRRKAEIYKPVNNATQALAKESTDKFNKWREQQVSRTKNYGEGTKARSNEKSSLAEIDQFNDQTAKGISSERASSKRPVFVLDGKDVPKEIEFGGPGAAAASKASAGRSPASLGVKQP